MKFPLGKVPHEIPYKIPGHTAFYVGSLYGTHAWIGWPFWGGLAFCRSGFCINVHLQGLLGLLGHTGTIRRRWFFDSWRVLLWSGPTLIFRGKH